MMDPHYKVVVRRRQDGGWDLSINATTTDAERIASIQRPGALRKVVVLAAHLLLEIARDDGLQPDLIERVMAPRGTRDGREWSYELIEDER